MIQPMSYDNKFSGHGLVGTPVVEYLKDSGDSIDGTQDTSGAAKAFGYTASADMRVFTLSVKLQDTALRAAQYGGDAAELTNGIRVRVNPASGDDVYLDGGVPIKSNTDWTALPGGSQTMETEGAGDDMIVFKVNFVEGLGAPIRIPSGDAFEVVTEDDLSVLTVHEFIIGGCLEDSAPSGS